MKTKYTEKMFYDGVIVYKNSTNMIKNCPGLYQFGFRNGLLKNANWPDRKSRTGIDEDRLKKEIFNISLDSDSRKDFQNKHPLEYNIAWRHGWLDEMTWLKPKMNIFVDKVYYIYAYFFTDQNSCYIGLSHHGTTYNRDCEHRRQEKSQVFKFAKNNNIEIPAPIIIEDGLTRHVVQEREDFWKTHYIDSGWCVLNVGKTGKCSGSLGGGFIKWTYEKCYEEAKKYHSKKEMREKSRGAFNAAAANGWLGDYTWFVRLIPRRAPRQIVQYDLDGNFVRRHDSAINAASLLGIAYSHIVACCKGRAKTAYGYVWKYADDVPARPVQTLLAI